MEIISSSNGDDCRLQYSGASCGRRRRFAAAVGTESLYGFFHFVCISEFICNICLHLFKFYMINLPPTSPLCIQVFYLAFQATKKIIIFCLLAGTLPTENARLRRPRVNSCPSM